MATVTMRYGQTLSEYVNVHGSEIRVEQAGFTFDGWALTPKTDGEYSYRAAIPGTAEYCVANLEAETMPVDGKNLYPVLIRHRVQVQLDGAR